VPPVRRATVVVDSENLAWPFIVDDAGRPAGPNSGRP